MKLLFYYNIDDEVEIASQALVAEHETGLGWGWGESRTANDKFHYVTVVE